jgi:hypothetical protein
MASDLGAPVKTGYLEISIVKYIKCTQVAIFRVVTPCSDKVGCRISEELAAFFVRFMLKAKKQCFPD